MDEGREDILRHGMIFFAGYIAFFVLIILAIYWGVSDRWQVAPSLAWVIVVIGGFSLSLALLFSGALLFRVFDMHRPDHAMALPPNSIRSLLTFLIFAILLAFIFYSVQTLTSTPEREEEAYFNDEDAADDFQNILEKREIFYSRFYVDVEDENGEIIPGANGQPEFRIKVTYGHSNDVKDSTREYYNQILIALFGITGSVMGFYFGSRSIDATAQGQELVSGGIKEAQDKTAGEGEAPVADTDGASWSLSSSALALAEGTDGILTGKVDISTDPDDAARPFGADFVPSETHDQALDEAVINVVRDGNTLTLTAPTAKVEDITAGTQIAIYLEGEEDHAQTIDVTVG